MKKIFVVIVLFALPIIAYLFFASGVHNFAKLPTLTEDVHEPKALKNAEGEKLTFQDHITILAFFGKQPQNYTGHSYNLAEKIYDTYYKFKDLQLLVLVPEGTATEVEKLEEELAGIVDPVKWKFAFASPEEIKNVFESLQTDLVLDEDLSSPYVFIIDKKGNLRGRNDDDDEGLLYGYDTSSVAILDDKMTDDIKVILAEYRMALKKYNNKEEGE